MRWLGRMRSAPLAPLRSAQQLLLEQWLVEWRARRRRVGRPRPGRRRPSPRCDGGKRYGGLVHPLAVLRMAMGTVCF